MWYDVKLELPLPQPIFMAYMRDKIIKANPLLNEIPLFHFPNSNMSYINRKLGNSKETDIQRYY